MGVTPPIVRKFQHLYYSPSLILIIITYYIVKARDPFGSEKNV